MQLPLTTLLALAAAATVTACPTPEASDNSKPASPAVKVAKASSPQANSATSPLTSAASGTLTSLGSVVSGEATFYGGNLAGGMCAFSTYTLPSGIYGTAFSGSAWDTAAHCGECLTVTGPDGTSTVTAMVVDQCPECAASHLDLFTDTFDAVGGTASEGIIDISYEFVTCPITSAVELINDSGTSEYWFAMLVQNAAEPVAKFEVSTDGGSTWTAVARNTNNMFENSSGFGTDSVSVRLTGESGGTLTVEDVDPTAGSTFKASGNFS